MKPRSSSREPGFAAGGAAVARQSRAGAEDVLAAGPAGEGGIAAAGGAGVWLAVPSPREAGRGLGSGAADCLSPRASSVPAIAKASTATPTIARRAPTRRGRAAAGALAGAAATGAGSCGSVSPGSRSASAASSSSPSARALAGRRVGSFSRQRRISRSSAGGTGRYVDGGGGWPSPAAAPPRAKLPPSNGSRPRNIW